VCKHVFVGVCTSICVCQCMFDRVYVGVCVCGRSWVCLRY
jgi:hypothetical protein